MSAVCTRCAIDSDGEAVACIHTMTPAERDRACSRAMAAARRILIERHRDEYDAIYRAERARRGLRT